MGRLRSLKFESFGLIACIESDDPDLLAGVPAVLPPGSRLHETGRISARFGLMRDGTLTHDGIKVAGPDLHAALERLGDAVRHHLAEHAPKHIFIHAGVVSVDGFGIVIPGSSRSGKSTLVAELVTQGATYYSDEYAVVDGSGLINPYAKPISLRPDLGAIAVGLERPPWITGEPRPAANGGQILEWMNRLASSRRTDHRKVQIPEEQSGQHPVRAGLIVVTHYRAGARWRPRALGAGEGAMALLEHTVPARARPADAMAAARRLCTDATVLAGARGEARAAARAILRTVERIAA